MPITFEDCHSSRRLGVNFWAPKCNCGMPVDKYVKVLEVYLEDLPRVIGRGLSDLSSRGIWWGLSVFGVQSQLPQLDVQFMQQLELVYQIVVSSSSLPGFKFLNSLLSVIPLLENLWSTFWRIWTEDFHHVAFHFFSSSSICMNTCMIACSSHASILYACIAFLWWFSFTPVSISSLCDFCQIHQSLMDF
jgi:hypothetical protein